MNEKNLKQPWKKGESGNPNGRPRNQKLIPELLREIAARIATGKDKQIIVDPITGEPMTWMKAMLVRVFDMAVKGDMAAVNFIADRTEGKAITPITLTEGTSLTVTEKIVYAGQVDSNITPSDAGSIPTE